MGYVPSPLTTHTAQGASPNDFFQNNVIVTFRGERGQPCDVLSANGTVLQEKVTILQLSMSSSLSAVLRQTQRWGKSKATVISDGRVIQFDIRGVTLWGGFQLNVTMTLFWKKQFGDAPLLGCLDMLSSHSMHCRQHTQPVLVLFMRHRLHHNIMRKRREVLQLYGRQGIKVAIVQSETLVPLCEHSLT